MNSLVFWFVRFSRRLLVRAGFYALFAVAVALAAVVFAPFVPSSLAERLGGEAIEGVLSALATSLLAVTTFSASVVVVAYTAASSQFTPRAATFVTADVATQRTLATFIGAFLFTIVALVALGARYYGPEGRAIVFLATLLMVGVVAVRLVGWIDQVSRLAVHDQLLGKIEAATREALETRARRPFLGGARLVETDTSGTLVRANRSGYIANIDPEKLQATAERLDSVVSVLRLPGDYAHEGEPLLRVAAAGALSSEHVEALLDAFALQPSRTFEQDPGQGLQVLVEIAARALSPGVNDPGTAILVIDSCQRLLTGWAKLRSNDPPAPAYDRIRARDLDGDALIDRSFGEIARYAAADAMVAERLQRALAALATGPGADLLAPSARRAGALALERTDAALAIDADRRRVRDASQGGRDPST